MRSVGVPLALLSEQMVFSIMNRFCELRTSLSDKPTVAYGEPENAILLLDSFKKVSGSVQVTI